MYLQIRLAVDIPTLGQLQQTFPDFIALLSKRQRHLDLYKDIQTFLITIYLLTAVLRPSCMASSLARHSASVDFGSFRAV